MTDITKTTTSPILKKLPLIVIGIVAVLGAFFLRDYLTFQALAENREALLDFRDANYPATVLVFVATYVVIVSFSRRSRACCLM